MSTLPVMARAVPADRARHARLYHWTHEDALNDPVIAAKAAYLNTPFFLARALFYFVSLDRYQPAAAEVVEGTGRDRRSGLRRASSTTLSAAGLVVYALTVTFAITDWLMSVNPHWFSTMWGPLFMVGQALAALAVTINVLVLLAGTAPMDRVLNASHFHDLGKFLFAFLMMWAYLTFSQFLIVYSANLQEEVPHYLTRSQNGYQYVTIALILLHFVVPYVILLSRDVKRDIDAAAGDGGLADPDADRRLLLAGCAGVPRRR